jgi:hypothetical protein
VDAAGPALGNDSADIGALSCATSATPDVLASSQVCGGPNGPCDLFVVDTGLAPNAAVGTSYGQPGCPDQYLAEADLVASGAAESAIFITGSWSLAVPPLNCANYAVTLTVWGYDGAAWSLYDRVKFQGQPPAPGGPPGCQTVVASSLQNEGGGDGSTVWAGRFTKLRVAIVATDCGRLLPVLLTAAVVPG